MFKSKKLKELTLQKLDFELEIFRVGKIKTTELFRNSPIEIRYDILNEKAYDQTYYLKYLGANQFLWSKNKEIFQPANKLIIGDSVQMKGFNFLVATNKSNLSCLLYTSPSPRDLSTSRMPSSA